MQSPTLLMNISFSFSFLMHAITSPTQACPKKTKKIDQFSDALLKS
jgi:hypothetical protein